MDDKLESKITLIVLWFIPLAVLMFGFYRFAIKPNIWMVILMCVASVMLGWLLEAYLDV
jgi:arginine exporter protein ArgO